MREYVSLLRGINVGGKRMIRMPDLVKLYEDNGLEDVITYIQSGNILFNSSSDDLACIEKTIENAIRKQYGFEVPVIIRSARMLEAINLNNPFLNSGIADTERLYLTFLKYEPSPQKVSAIESIVDEHDKFELIGKEIYIYCEQRYSDTKYSNSFFESKLKVGASTRNWNTVNKLIELTQAK